VIASETGVETLAVPADVTRVSAVDQLRVETQLRFGKATILVNCAGTFGPLAPLAESQPNEWIQTLMVNTVGPYLTCRAFVPGMLEGGWGRIVNVSSAASLTPPDVLNSAYSTSKAALNRLTRHLAAEVTGTGVTAALIHPGSMKTEMWAEIRERASAMDEPSGPFQAWAQLVERTGGDPLWRAAALVLELVDPKNSGRNGEFCWIDNGIEPLAPSW
jgi:NAD(P)-dependent dehydrogenase (short-subunit alcohol dehydrogenase family)